MKNYPDPCKGCRNKTCNYYACQPWLTRFRYRQKLINGYAKKVLPDYDEKIKVGVHYDDEKN